MNKNNKQLKEKRNTSGPEINQIYLNTPNKVINNVNNNTIKNKIKASLTGPYINNTNNINISPPINLNANLPNNLNNIMNQPKIPLNFSSPPIRMVESTEGLESYQDDENLEKVMETKTEKDSSEPKLEINLEEKVNISIQMKHDTICRATTVKTIPMLVSLNVDEIKVENKTNVDMICVIDKSGSMQGEKWKMLVESMDAMLEYLGSKDRFSIVIFDNRAVRLTPLLCMTPENKKLTMENLNAISPNGGTDIGEGLRHALEIIKQRRYSNAVTSILLLSDGLDHKASNKVHRYVYEYEVKKHITDPYTINTFGYGSDHDPALMNFIAEKRNGSFYFIDKLEKVDESFVDCLGGLVSVVAQEVVLSVKTNNFARITKVYGSPGFWNYNGVTGQYYAKILQLISGKSLDYVFEIELLNIDKTADLDSIEIASATCEMKSLKSYKSYFKNCVGKLNLSDDIMLLVSNPENENVVLNYFRVKSSEVMEKAVQFSDAGNYDAAKGALEIMKKEISTSNYSNSIQTKNIVGDIEASLKNVRPEIYKAMGKHYIMENKKANLNQISNLNSNMNYSNKIQMEMRSVLIQNKKEKKSNY